MMPTPQLFLQTSYLLNPEGCIISTRDPHPRSGPLFCLVRGKERCAWAVHADLPQSLTVQIEALARTEPPVDDFHNDPVHTAQYVSLTGGRSDRGLAFTFPDILPNPGETVFIKDLRPLTRHFQGWVADEIPGRIPIVAMTFDGHAVSVCFCARRSDVAAEAGLETAISFRGRGFGPRVTAAWAQAIRASGLVPLYSTAQTNKASLAVARKLGLAPYADLWSLFS